ncbi:gamma-glutamyl-gamma-aminobutyrate hydrolase family protein [Ruania alba]|uniref:Putative glutamine amidotransferase n=1 Tax=Ruania alba TaxID=648782 RepID=A0A1H5NA85_9MICO|nr:gamma-glutamyl-gamma-aminobutyrate hydrolase family protein [Ruania alba]SEE98465.1 putative glutamine amidotransferase [Ruania alba]
MSGRRPVVAISGRRENASWGLWDRRDTALLSWDYVHAVQHAGADVAILPPGGHSGQLTRFDGLIIAGGADVGSRRYGEPPHPEADPAPSIQDDLEFTLLAEALARGLPVLGICRGMQILTIASGGTLIQHLPDQLDAAQHLEADGDFGYHPVSITAGSRLSSIYGSGPSIVRTMHHQAAATTGSLLVTARADDGTIEAVEDPARAFVVGVQWHPEVDNDEELFRQFVIHAASTHSSDSVALSPLNELA